MYDCYILRYEKKKLKSIAIIIVSYNSQRFIDKNLEYLDIQSYDNFKLYIIDSGSEELIRVVQNLSFDVEIVDCKKNVGFAKANNIGIKRATIENFDFFLFLNPDAFLPQHWLKLAVENFTRYDKDSKLGILSGPLIGYSLEDMQPTGLIDSLGIYQKWYGKWYDKYQGKSIDIEKRERYIDKPMAICGALMFCSSSLIQSLFSENGMFFNERYITYKEDLELSLRVGKLGKQLVVDSSLTAFHCRGWSLDRGKVPYFSKYVSARNELFLHLKYSLIHLPYSSLKFVYVILFERFNRK